ncbi:hypothetical protein C5167_030291 [Papaver somniferum]|nr:hypothetical protein C5167_030291 [Papaver somniferum]
MATNGAVVDHVLVEENLHARTVILNRAHRLNALSYQMVSRLHEVYTACEKDPEVKLVILRVGTFIDGLLGISDSFSTRCA